MTVIGTREADDLSADLLPSTSTGRVGSILRLAPILRRHPGRFALTVAASAGNQASGLAAAGMAAWLTGLAATGAEVSRLIPGLAMLAGLVVAKGALSWAESWVAHDLSYRIMAHLRGDIFDGLARLAPGWLLGKRTGDVAAAALADVEALEWFYAHTVAQFAVTVLTPAGAIGVLAFVDARLALVLLPFAALIVTVPFWLIRLGDRQGATLRTRLGALHAEAVDGVDGLRELVQFGRDQEFRQHLRRAGQRLNRAQLANASRVGMENGVTDGLVAAAMLAVLAVGAALVAGGSLAEARFPVAVILAGFSLMPITQITGGLRDLGVLRATASRVFTVVDTPAHVVDRPGASSSVASLGAEVCFEDVRFRYGPDLDDVLHGISFTVHPGETVALVGRSGAGKSTCANLLLRFWDVAGGRVTLGGVDIRDLTQEDLRQRVALVPQDVYLFNASIADNIRLGRPDASDAEVTEVAERALVTEFADQLPDRLATMVGERGAALSGGQRQRIALARVLLRDAPVLVLDEAVSNVDAEGETHLRRTLDSARAGRTTVVIAHRLSTIRSADRVVVLDGGWVVQEGRHESLAATHGPYRQLLASQVDAIEGHPGHPFEPDGDSQQ